MANLAELALTEAALKTLADQISGQLNTVRAEMQNALETSGASQVRAKLPDGTRVSTISLRESRMTANVVDPDVFLGWVQEAAPREVTTVTMVRPAYKAELLKRISAAGKAELLDPVTGEIRVVPGVEVSMSEATHSVRLEEDCADRIDAARRAGHLAHLDLPHLMQGSTANA